MDERLLEVSVVARRLACSSNTVIKMLADPKNPLKGVRLNRCTIRVFESSLIELLDKRTIEKQTFPVL